MQPLKSLIQSLAKLADSEHYLFALDDLRALFPDLSDGALKTLISRAVSAGALIRVCRGLYLYDQVEYPRGLILFHAAARLRADMFNYLSLETVLSDAGVISQVLMNRITLMSSGRTYAISCGKWGVIEFVHTTQKPTDLEPYLIYDAASHLWRASVPQALKDMRATRRSLDLIDWSVANEFI